MARSKTPARELLDDAVRIAVVAVLKPLGFRKSALNFHRRQGSVVQVVNLQGSTSSSHDNALFYVNVGLAFDEICRLTGQDVLDKPREVDCTTRGIRERLERLIRGAPKRWSLHVGVDSEPTTDDLYNCTERLAKQLETIDGPAAYRDHPWFNRFRPSSAAAQVLYVLDELDDAWDEVGNLAKSLSGRRNADDVAWWVEHLGLDRLRP